MSTTMGVIIALVIIALIVMMALALYRSDFRLKKLTVKGGFAEAELERKASDEAAAPAAVPAPGIEQSQRASGRRSLIENSPQQAGIPGTRQEQGAMDGGQIKSSGQTAAGPASQQQRASDDGVVRDSPQRVE